jgi:acyl-CoA thioesterase-2
MDRLPEAARDWITRERPVEIRPIDAPDLIDPEKRPPVQRAWIRATGPLPDDIALHQCVLAYASDMTLLDTALLPHGISWVDEKLQSASIDHAMWFHHPFRADEWLFYDQDSPSASGARGYNRGNVFTRDGKLVASVAQEGLMRLWPA